MRMSAKLRLARRIAGLSADDRKDVNVLVRDLTKQERGAAAGTEGGPAAVPTRRQRKPKQMTVEDAIKQEVARNETTAADVADVVAKALKGEL